MNLKIKFRNIFNEPCVEFNVDCFIDDDGQELLHAEVPIGIAELTDLDLSHDHGPKLRRIPDSIERLTSLELLSIVNNELNSIPSSIGNLTNLQILYLNRNRLTSIPRSIGNLSYLTQLNLADNHLTTLPTSIGNLTSLEYLNLSNNQLTSFPQSIISLTGLTTLNLSNNAITEIQLEIENLSQLVVLQLQNNPPIMINPFRVEYVFANPNISNGIRDVFNIHEYNRLLEAALKEKTVNERTPTMKLSTGLKNYFKTHNRPPTRKNTAVPAFYNRRILRHITSFLGSRHAPMRVEDVIK